MGGLGHHLNEGSVSMSELLKSDIVLTEGSVLNGGNISVELLLLVSNFVFFDDNTASQMLEKLKTEVII